MTQPILAHPVPQRRSVKTLMFAAIGVVFGDIGTSPLYALKEAFDPAHGIPLNSDAILGVISLLFWAIVVVVALKYVFLVMRADNKGEGGVLALMALSLRGLKPGSKSARVLVMIGIFGACMFYGDAVITPAISVMSAVEGLEIAAPHLSPYVLPITLIILFALFWFQKRGTEVAGNLFGPIMLVWFVVLATLGTIQIIQAPQIIAALNPIYAINFIIKHALQAYIVLGSVVLVLTGAEALYADMGHFGAKPIRQGWYWVVMPALVLNYFGQGALLLHNPAAIQNPFYLLAPAWALLPLIILATIATVIASQAVISGAFSLTSQAIHLGYVPRMKIQHTSAREIGQIYIPLVNWLLLTVIVFVVLSFKTSGNLAAAYGIAVTTTMVTTTILVGVVMIRIWHWNKYLVATIITGLMIVDLGFFGANLIKIAEGGWLPIMIGAFLFYLLLTWHAGRKSLKARTAEAGIPLPSFIESLLAYPPHRVLGNAIYLNGNEKLVPTSLLHNLKHNKVLHERTIFITCVTRDVPYIDDGKRIELLSYGSGVYSVKAFYGFNEIPDISHVLESLEKEHNMPFELMDTSFFIARETVVPTQLPGMSVWRERIFAWMHQNSAKPTDFFRIPANRVVELGTKVEI